jgi:isopenicillin-N N-acyltransferase-like protein
MLIIKLAGNHYDMGRQHGQKLSHYRAAISDLVEAHRKKIETYPQGAIFEIRKEMKDVLAIHSPRTLDMIHGIADGFGLSRNNLLSMMIGSYYEDKLTSLEEKGSHEDGCTTWAYSKKKGAEEGILLAKNRDYLISHRDLQVVLGCKPDNGNEYFSVNSIGACSVFSSGMNKEGLAIADTRVPSFDAGPGLPRFSLMMHILEEFRYVDEALDFLNSVPRMGGGNLVFADASGNIGSAEVGYQSLDLLKKDTGGLICTNHFEGPTMRKKYRQKDRAKERDSKERYGEVLRRLSGLGQELTPRQTKGLMSFHGETFNICNHGNVDASEKTATISSTLFLPEKKGFYYCEGFPCESPYHWISF